MALAERLPEKERLLVAEALLKEVRVLAGGGRG